MRRCKAGDSILTESELRKVDFNNNQFLDLCYGCAVVSNLALLEEDDRIDQSIDETLRELGFDLSNN